MSFDASTLKHFDTAQQAAAFVAEQIVSACKKAVEQRDVFHWVLAGGSTPELCYRLLRDADLPWGKVHCWFGDERALPAGDPQRNETMARLALLDHVPMLAGHIHAIHFNQGTEAAAIAYARQMKEVSTFDFVLLGMGEDGHTASLFPNNPALESAELAVPVYQSPKPPLERVGMGLKALNNHQQCMILATGSSKKEVLKNISLGAPLPVSRIDRAVWVVDTAAWSNK